MAVEAAATLAPPAPPPPVASSSVSDVGGQPGEVGADRLLQDLREYHQNATRKRAEGQHERSVLLARLESTERQVQLEESAAEDLVRRLGCLESALQRERLQYERRLASSTGAGSNTEADSQAAGQAWEAGNAGKSPRELSSQQLRRLLAASRETVPDVREESRRVHLQDFLREAGIPWTPPAS
eukprot:TRINITY_DN23166_c0_g1_i1.p2 TRINITY_DN23166_c0_g1~~TRINITY_DN23166_c0_g1_i1.p2  ORF type:complete len:184 (-),score=36.57 TRINITY_DN23166_c0_g1_i1:170-721(-)